jgi:hypothetical protein
MKKKKKNREIQEAILDRQQEANLLTTWLLVGFQGS